MTLTPPIVHAPAANEGDGHAPAVSRGTDKSSSQQLELDFGVDLFRRHEHSSAQRSRSYSWIARAVADFHKAFGLPLALQPDPAVSQQLLNLRVSLLDEEASEFSVACMRRDIVGIADALADIVYVAYGSAISVGIDLDAVLREVHRSNMSKLDWSGRPIIRHDGKVLKSPRYSPPDLECVLASQIPLPF